MPTTIVLLVLALAGCLLGCPAEARGETAEQSPGQTSDRGGQPVGETMVRIRAGARAMALWLADRGRTPPPASRREQEGRQLLRWERCPSIAFDDLESLLVPRYLEELPREDAWGNPLEFCLDRWERSRDRYLMGVRSPGPGGEFEADRYRMGPFDPEAPAFDIVWIDSFFVTWPEIPGG